MNKNFKATKTVLALAVAGLISSGVFAADIANVTIGQGGVLTVTGAANGTNSAAGNSVADGDVAATDASNTAATIGTDAFANPIDLTINGGSLTVKANAESATGNGVLFIDDLTTSAAQRVVIRRLSSAMRMKLSRKRTLRCISPAKRIRSRFVLMRTVEPSSSVIRHHLTVRIMTT